MSTALTYFSVTGFWDAISNPSLQADSDAPTVSGISGLVTFTPRLPVGRQFNIEAYSGNNSEDTGIFLLPIYARIFNGVLVSLDDADTPGVELVANSDALGLSEPLIFDVQFTNVTYGSRASFSIANFGFVAPVDSTPVVLTDPSLQLLPYLAPSNATWTPPPSASAPLPVGYWRGRTRDERLSD